jgi:fructokinase
MTAPRIVGIGELLWDLLPTGPRLGGATANFTIMSARLGNHATLVSSVGNDDYGRQARAQLDNPEHLQRDPDHPTGTVEVTLTPGHPPHYTIARPVAWDFIRPTPALIAEAQSSSALCYGTLVQRNEISRATLRTLVASAPATCVRVCDINLRMPDCTAEVLLWSMQQATILKVSDEELPLAFSFLGLDAPTTPEAAAQTLLQQFPGCKVVAATLGAHGSLVADRQNTARHPGFPVTVVDTVGAGDAFTAGLLHAYLRGASLAQMAEAGNLCGSYVASQPGATPVLPAELLERLRIIGHHG